MNNLFDLTHIKSGSLIQIVSDNFYDKYFTQQHLDEFLHTTGFYNIISCDSIQTVIIWYNTNKFVLAPTIIHINLTDKPNSEDLVKFKELYISQNKIFRAITIISGNDELPLIAGVTDYMFISDLVY